MLLKFSTGNMPGPTKWTFAIKGNLERVQWWWGRTVYRGRWPGKLTPYLSIVSSPLRLARQHEIGGGLLLPRSTRHPPGRGLQRALNSFTLRVTTRMSQIAAGQQVSKLSIGLLLLAACSCIHYFLFSGVSGLARGNLIISIRYIV
jgi:hypothetical protein